MKVSMRAGWIIVLAAMATGAALSAALFVGLWLFVGPHAICAKGLICKRILVERVGASRAIHLVGTADFHHGFTVVWETPGKQSTPRVQYRAKGAEAWSVATGRSESAPNNGWLRNSGQLHKVTVTDLEPGQVYEYRVSNDPASRLDWTYALETSTLARDRPVTLAYVSDVCLQGDPERRAGGVETTRQYLEQDKPDFILGGGDYACALDDGRYRMPEPAILQWFDEWQPVLSRAPFLAQYGNHDCCHGENIGLWQPRLEHGWAPSRSPDGYSFSFDIADVHFVGFFETGFGMPSAGTLEWLDTDLRDARARGVDFLVVYQHGPMLSVGRNHPPNLNARQLLVPILERNEVDLHLSGGDQSFERTPPLRDAANGNPTIGSLDEDEAGTWTGVVYNKASPAGRRVRVLPNLPSQIPDYIAIADDKSFYYSVLTLDGHGELQVVTYAIGDDGERSIIDAFTLRRGPSAGDGVADVRVMPEQQGIPDSPLLHP